MSINYIEANVLTTTVRCHLLHAELVLYYRSVYLHGTF